MAIAFRELQQASVTNGTQPAITFTGLQTNDLVLIFIATGTNTGSTFPDTWQAEDGGDNTGTAVTDNNNGAVTARIDAFKYAGGSQVFRSVGVLDTSHGHCIGGLAFSGVDVSNMAGLSFIASATQFDSATGSSTNPDPPALPADATAGNVAVVCAVSANNDAAKTLPTGYTNEIDVAGNGAGTDAAIGMGSKAIAAGGAENPAAFGSWATGAWIAFTIELQAAAAVKIPLFMHHYKLMAAA